MCRKLFKSIIKMTKNDLLFEISRGALHLRRIQKAIPYIWMKNCFRNILHRHRRWKIALWKKVRIPVYFVFVNLRRDYCVVNTILTRDFAWKRGTRNCLSIFNRHWWWPIYDGLNPNFETRGGVFDQKYKGNGLNLRSFLISHWTSSILQSNTSEISTCSTFFEISSRENNTYLDDHQGFWGEKTGIIPLGKQLSDITGHKNKKSRQIYVVYFRSKDLCGS